jgi:hypothetical protein
MEWLKQTGTLFTTHSDRVGRVGTLRDILFNDFADNLNDICKLRNLNSNDAGYDESKRRIKANLQCFALNELHNRTDVLKHSGLMQLDFDEKDCEGYDIEEMKQAVFALPFIAFVSLSCSGNGFYAIAAIAEPEKQKEYAIHIFEVLQHYGVTCDKSKGRNYNDLRYVSYDANMLHREKVEPLLVRRFKPQQRPAKHMATSTQPYSRNAANKAIRTCYANVMAASIGQRWETVQKAAFTLGGVGDAEAWQAVEQAIYSNPAFTGEHDKYLRCAESCFHAGKQKPLSNVDCK